MIPIDSITGLVLAGGRGSRMGGVDKGLQNHLGLPLGPRALVLVPTRELADQITTELETFADAVLSLWLNEDVKPLTLEEATALAQRDVKGFEAPAKNAMQLHYVLAFGAHGAHPF